MKKLKKVIIFIAVIVLAGSGIYYYLTRPVNNTITKYSAEDLNISYQPLTKNPYSRSGKPLRRVEGIVVHYTANPGASAKNNRDYFENLKSTHITYASSHFVIGIKGEIIQCLPLNEWSYASNHRNKDTISIECCHPSRDGHFTNATYQSLVKLVQSLINTYHLKVNQVIRHYDVTGKLCPLYFVKNPLEWKKFKGRLKDYHLF
ncbi:MAG: peptidoglycan recognition protein family protein [Eggerthia catenaformis]|uniref:peptidoglycan recognition protein family protein n=1 Tax=Eggerthia catenaformis TaxID=31973 RepID=UPI003FA188E0